MRVIDIPCEGYGVAKGCGAPAGQRCSPVHPCAARRSAASMTTRGINEHLRAQRAKSPSTCGNEGCGAETRVRYPGNDPENGPARPYCPEGHGTCYRCGGWFQAITRTEAWTDPETGLEVPAGTVESDWCRRCEEEHGRTHCGCGSDLSHRHGEYACCGGSMCCTDANE